MGVEQGEFEQRHECKSNSWRLLLKQQRQIDQFALACEH